jgi:Tfp pilus assembly protein PilF
MVKSIGLFFWMAAAGMLGAAATQAEYELRGKVLLPGGDPIKVGVPIALIEASSFPFSSRSLIGPSGDFKISNLRLGTYRLTIVIQGWGQMTVSVDVGPGTADDRNRVNRVFEFTPQKDTDGGVTISARQLNLPSAAWRGLSKAEKRLEKHDTDGAIRELQSLVKKYPDFPAAWNRLGTIAYLTGRYVDAERYFSTALKNDPDLYAPLVNIAAAYLNLGKIALALETNQRCVKLRPADPLAWSQLGQTQFVLGQFDEALKNLYRARELDPGHGSFPQLVIAEIHRQRGDFVQVIEVLEEFLLYHPDFAKSDLIRQLITKAKSSRVE